MAERVGFEPTDAFTSTDFKSAALSQTQPSLLKLIKLSMNYTYIIYVFLNYF